MNDPTKLPAWQALLAHHARLGDTTIADLFAGDPARFQNLSIAFGEMTLDVSKNRISDVTLSLLCDLAREAGLDQARADLFAGKRVNNTENRPALHMALRGPAAHKDPIAFAIDGRDVAPDVLQELDRMFGFAEEVRSGAFLGATGKKIAHIVNIGIGGSDLGPALVADALRPDIAGKCISLKGFPISAVQ